MPCYLYAIQCEANFLYVGVSDNPERRYKQHLNGSGARFTKIHRAIDLILSVRYETRSEAMRCEKAIKRLNYADKRYWIDAALGTIKTPDMSRFAKCLQHIPDRKD